MTRRPAYSEALKDFIAALQETKTIKHVELNLLYFRPEELLLFAPYLQQDPTLCSLKIGFWVENDVDSEEWIWQIGLMSQEHMRLMKNAMNALYCAASYSPSLKKIVFYPTPIDSEFAVSRLLNGPSVEEIVIDESKQASQVNLLGAISYSNLRKLELRGRQFPLHGQGSLKNLFPAAHLWRC
jgi:hypothetical protein